MGTDRRERRRWEFGLTLLLAAGILTLVSLSGATTGGAQASSFGLQITPLAHGKDLTLRITTTTIFLPFIHRVEVIVPNVWTAQYYANQTLSDEPEYTREEVRVDHEWPEGQGPANLPHDYFSIRWTGHWEFEPGEYTFFIDADDGVRLWLDDDLIVDRWTPGTGSYRARVPFVSDGLHKLTLEYFEGIGEATIRLRWRRTDLYPLWHGDYYSEPWVEGGWRYEQRDSAIQFDWGEGCPSGLPCDYFSVGWDAEPLFLTGTYRIFVYADDGHKLFVDGVQQGGSGWIDEAQDTSYDLVISGTERHAIAYDFHDQGTLAEARLWIEYLRDTWWTAEYYDNQHLLGLPWRTQSEPSVFVDWGLERPRPKAPSSDHFSIRWSVQRVFHSGCYRFGLFVDDGARLWVDDELLIDEWHDGRGEYHSLVTYLASGPHDLVIEYFDNVGEAEIRFWWE